MEKHKSAEPKKPPLPSEPAKNGTQLKGGEDGKKTEETTKISLVSHSSSVCCRICQLSSGKLFQPCSCKGTMGRIHNTCLNTWMNTSGNDFCELCHTNYRIQGTCFKPLNKWTPPKIDRQEVASFITSFCVIAWFCYCLHYLTALLTERDVPARIQNPQTNISPSDITAIVLIVICFLGIIPEVVGLSLDLSKRLKSYMDSQKIRMILPINEEK